jgi:hypothetical protein
LWFRPICYSALENKKAAWEAAFFYEKKSISVLLLNNWDGTTKIRFNPLKSVQSVVKTKPPLRAVAQE